MSISNQIKQSLKDIKMLKEATNAQLDIISRDIVAIEQELSQQFTRMGYIYDINDENIFSIAWDIHEIPSKKPKYRLLITYKTRDLSVITKPLVEIPSSIRLIAYKYIPEFIKGYSEFILNHSKELENTIKLVKSSQPNIDEQCEDDEGKFQDGYERWKEEVRRRMPK